MGSRWKIGLGALPIISALVATQAVASPEPRAVLELFVSQGCSACRTANQLMPEWEQEQNLIVLSFPVNYWDYLGWKDTLAHPLFGERQRGYALLRGDRQIYTPQMVINGVLSCIGSARDQVAKRVESATAVHPILPVPLALKEENGMILVDIGRGSDDAGVWLVPVRRLSQVAIQRGENAGRTETYTNVARGLYHLGTWTGSPARFEMSRKTIQAQDADSYVILLQKVKDGKPGPILGAVKGPGL